MQLCTDTFWSVPTPTPLGNKKWYDTTQRRPQKPSVRSFCGTSQKSFTQQLVAVLDCDWPTGKYLPEVQKQTFHELCMDIGTCVGNSNDTAASVQRILCICLWAFYTDWCLVLCTHSESENGRHNRYCCRKGIPLLLCLKTFQCSPKSHTSICRGERWQVMTSDVTGDCSQLGKQGGRQGNAPSKVFGCFGILRMTVCWPAADSSVGWGRWLWSKNEGQSKGIHVSQTLREWKVAADEFVNWANKKLQEVN